MDHHHRQRHRSPPLPRGDRTKGGWAARENGVRGDPDSLGEGGRGGDEEKPEEIGGHCDRGGGGGVGGPLSPALAHRVWDSFSSRFREVQAVLDQNRVLIAQVNENHQSKLPDNLTKNVALIREINLNISRVVSLYSDLSLHFSTLFHQPRQQQKQQLRRHGHPNSNGECVTSDTNGRRLHQRTPPMEP